MGISAQQHRVCTGLFNCGVCKVSVGTSPKYPGLYQCCTAKGIFVSFIILYLYIILYMTFMNLDSAKFIDTAVNKKVFVVYALPSIHMHLNLYCMIIICTGILNAFNKFNDGTQTYSFVQQASAFYTFVCSGELKVLSISILKRTFNSCMRWVAVMNGLALFVFILNKALIVICNPSILNPGPVNNDKPLSIFYNNIQGFINTNNLSSDTPPLNMTKTHEIHGYLYTHKPDVIILNETWLKGSILDSEILPPNYKIYRVDRTVKSHPWDPNQPSKFRKNGGGVLIAHRTDINISSSKVSGINVQAELLSVMLKFPSGKRVCISTFYRVGTLGIENFHEFERYFKTLAAKKKLDKHILIGDFNFSNVSWPDGTTSCDLYNEFLNFLLVDLGNTQFIKDV